MIRHHIGPVRLAGGAARSLQMLNRDPVRATIRGEERGVGQAKVDGHRRGRIGHLARFGKTLPAVLAGIRNTGRCRCPRFVGIAVGEQRVDQPALVARGKR